MKKQKRPQPWTWAQEFEVDRFMRTQNFFETIYPTLTERARHLLRREYEKHRSA